MKTHPPVPELMTFSAVARKLDVPLPKAARLLSKGVLRPDYRLGDRVFFLESRFPQIRREYLNFNQSNNLF